MAEAPETPDDGDEFDVLTFFICVMGVLTVIVVSFTYFVLYQRVEKQSKSIRTELRNLRKIEDLASDERFKDWIRSERGGNIEQGSASEFNARIIQSARSQKVRVDRLDPKRPIKHGNFQEMPFNVSLKKCQLEPLMRFFFDIEEKWAGAKVKQLQLNWREKEKSWSAEATISIFNTPT
jgi:type II secretory pathway component PulM